MFNCITIAICRLSAIGTNFAKCSNLDKSDVSLRGTEYLRLTITTNQRLKIEMFANEDYKERHGQLPKRRRYRATQAFAYPKEALDLLDAAIRKMVARKVNYLDAAPDKTSIYQLISSKAPQLKNKQPA